LLRHCTAGCVASLGTMIADASDVGRHVTLRHVMTSSVFVYSLRRQRWTLAWFPQPPRLVETSNSDHQRRQRRLSIAVPADRITRQTDRQTDKQTHNCDMMYGDERLSWNVTHGGQVVLLTNCDAYLHVVSWLSTVLSERLLRYVRLIAIPSVVCLSVRRLWRWYTLLMWLSFSSIFCTTL